MEGTRTLRELRSLGHKTQPEVLGSRYMQQASRVRHLEMCSKFSERNPSNRRVDHVSTELAINMAAIFYPWVNVDAS